MTLLTKRMVEKPWGKDILPAPFVAPEGKRIGEVWFEPPPEMPSILVKYIFTSEKLSVQVHPSDAQTESMGLGRQGKEECWLVIDAEPGATLAIGFKQDFDVDAMRQAALDGSIEQLMMWHPVKAGDFFYIPSGTVHAIGAGVSLIEIQQNSDITYRLFDYGRQRELHLDRGLLVANGSPYDLRLRQNLPAKGSFGLANGPYFSADRVDGVPQSDILSTYDCPVLVLPLMGKVVSCGTEYVRGSCGFVSSARSLAFENSQLCVLIRHCNLTEISDKPL